MERRTLGRTGLEVAMLGFGAAPIGYLDARQEQVDRVVQALLDAGVDLFDTAACYPGSEASIGKALGSRRDDVVLVTKCGHATGGLKGEEWSAELIEKSIDRSLRELRTDRLDVVLLHSCSLDVLRRGHALEALVRARDAGKTRHIGYSGDGDEAEYAANLADIEVLETSLNICDQSNITKGLARARENHLGVIAKRPLANAAWKRLDDQPGMYRNYARTYAGRFAAMGLTVEDVGLSGDPEVIWPKVALRFAAYEPGVDVAIVGTTNAEHARANITAVEEGPLSAPARRRLQEAVEKASRLAGERWAAQI